MSKKIASLRNILIYAGLITSVIVAPKPAQGQLLPHVWATVGVQDEDISYGGGVRLFDFGLEVGTGEDGATGADVLKFISLPVVSPYVGLGWYSGDDNFAYSAGVHFDGLNHIVIGVGYHSIRGINGQIGFKF